MKTISTQAVITSLSSKSDGSLGLRLSTPELKNDEKVAFMELQNVNLKILLQPLDLESKDIKEVKGELDTKTASQRLRAVLFVWWKQTEQGDFADFYLQHMEKFIEHVKTKLED